MNTKIIKTLFKKEMLDVFRDKKTVIMMLVVPVLLYPLIFVGVMQVMAFINSSMEEQNYRIAVETEDGGAFCGQLAQAGERETAEDGTAYQITVVDAGSIGGAGGEKAWEEALENEEIDAYVATYDLDGRMQYDVYYLSSVTNSSYAADLVMDMLEDFREELTRKRIAEEGLEAQEILEPICYERKNTASSEQSLGSIIGSVLPFMLVVSLLMGTMYPAIDTTAGERERGTLETLLTLPVTNRDLIMAKFLTVAVIGMVSALLNMLSMGGIAVYMYQIMDLQTEMADIDMVKFIPAILVCILAVFAFSLFISAVTMCVTSFAKSYKEANNYITPLMLVVMFTGYIGFIPNLELTQGIAMMPVANICLLVKNMMVFKIDYGMIAVVLASNVAYAILAVLFLSRIYDSESILFSDGKGGLQIFERRENMTRGGVPAVADAMFVMAVTLLLLLYAGSILQLKYGLAGVFATQMFILAVPLFLVVYTKRDMRQTYGFARAKVQEYVGSAFLSAGLFFVNLVIAAGFMQLFPQSAENVETAFSEIMGDNMAAVLFVIALTPAVCEELLFRGLVFHAVKAKHRVATACIVTAALFGCFHLSLVKFVPTGLLGLILCLVVWRTGSIYPAMLMHCINNALSVVISYCPEQIGKVFPVLYKSSFSLADGLFLFGVGAVLAAIGAVILWRGRKG
ncbi:MAG: ABC transporter permease [Lachnospiraceae bacterium]|nr:ABC transporter permease [Lachnospiraceae bacterium]